MLQLYSPGNAKQAQELCPLPVGLKATAGTSEATEEHCLASGPCSPQGDSLTATATSKLRTNLGLGSFVLLEKRRNWQGCGNVATCS